MKLFLTYFKNEVLTITLIVVLLIFSLGTLILALKKEDKILFVSLSENGPVVSSSLDEKQEKFLQKIFIKRFAQLYMTFDKQSFDSNLRDLRPFLSTSIEAEMDQKFLDLKNTVEKNEIVQTAVIEKIVKNDEVFEIYLDVLATKGTTKFAHKMRLNIAIMEIDRSLLNPFGFEITKLEEKEI